MINLNDLKKGLSSLGLELSEFVEVRERPGRPYFAHESSYTYMDLAYGKVHIRKEGDIFIQVITKLVGNWKERVKDIRLKGTVSDAVGGILWVREKTLNDLEEDVRVIIQYLGDLKAKQAQKVS